MPASLRELRQRRAAVTTTKKITRAMELIAASRIIKAQQRATGRAVRPGADPGRLGRGHDLQVDHPLTTQVETRRRRRCW